MISRPAALVLAAQVEPDQLHALAVQFLIDAIQRMPLPEVSDP